MKFPDHGVFDIRKNKNLIDLFYPPQKDKLKTFVISLDRRSDRREVFDNNNDNYLTYGYEYFSATDGKGLRYEDFKSMGYDTFKEWKDPLNKTNLTLGEVATTISHIRLWEKCIEINEPILVFEDDAIVTEDFSYDEIFSLLKEGKDMIYLGWLEMGESVSIDDKYVIPQYPYWNLAYVVTPDACRILVNDHIKQNIIPIDEYCPLIQHKLKTIAYGNNVVCTRSKSDAESDVDPQNRYDYILDFNTHVVTVATDESKCQKLYDSAVKQGIDIINLGKGVEWIGGDMSGPAGGQKVNLLYDYIQDLPDHDVVLFCDGYDVFFTDKIEEIVRRFIGDMGSRCDIIFSAEKICWPDESLESEFITKNSQLDDEYVDTPFKYLNSGLFIGRVGEIKKMIPDKIGDSDDDQLYYQKKYLNGDLKIIIDSECYIFQTHEPEVYKDGSQMYNPITRAYNCIYHGNGGEDAKEVLNRLYDQFFGSSGPILYIPTHHKYEILDDDMILIDYMTPSMCDDLIALADENGEWSHLEDDEYPAQEIRLKKLGLWDEMEKHWEESIYPIVHDFWNPMKMYGIRDAFVLRYALDTQTSLRRHCDFSLVTGSVKLNDNYEGAELYFPRQKISNKHIPVGKCILFPGQLTHGHECQELISGVKYSLTIWSSRYPGDVI
jgi:glycosyl transferase family 25